MSRTPTPWLDDGDVRLYHGDAREVLPRLDPADAVITDPPYNVGKDYGVGHDDKLGPDEYEAWLREILRLCGERAPEVVFFPGTRNLPRVHAILDGTGLRWHRTLGWHKKEFAGDKWNGGPAMCWEPIIWATRAEKPLFVTTFGTMGRDFYVVNATHGDPFTGPGRHPCPKPLSVLTWLVGLFVPPGGSLIDPFAGTSTALRAARDLGRRGVGVELSEDYLRLSAERLGQLSLLGSGPID